VAEYATVVGFVQFPVTERDLDSGDSVRDVTVRPAGVDAPLVRGTLWPEMGHVEIGEGDFVAFDGEYKERNGQGKDGGKVTYRNVNIRKINVNGKRYDAPVREVANKSGGSQKRSF
jgi:hypothetical protein